jgi:hypothetical protein
MKLNELFYEVLEVIIEYLNDFDKLNLRLVNRYFRSIRYKIKKEHRYNEEMVKIFSFEVLELFYHKTVNINYLESVKTLNISIHDSFDQYPPLLEKLNLNTNHFDIKTFPTTLKVLAFPSGFNDNIDLLPDSIEYLWLPLSFQQKINKYPKSLKCIYLVDYSYINDIPSHIKVHTNKNQMYSFACFFNEYLK